MKKAYVVVWNSKRYEGKWVATRTFLDKRVIASGKDIETVQQKTLKKGVTDPVIVYIPKKGEQFCFLNSEKAKREAKLDPDVAAFLKRYEAAKKRISPDLLKKKVSQAG